MDRLHLEAELPRELSIIREVCRHSFCSPEQWPELPDFNVFVRLAVWRYMERHPRRSHEQTVAAAARHFGINSATITKWLQRYRQQARRRTPRSSRLPAACGVNG